MFAFSGVTDNTNVFETPLAVNESYFTDTVPVIVVMSTLALLAGVPDVVTIELARLKELINCITPSMLTMMLFADAGTTDRVNVFEEPLAVNTSLVITNEPEPELAKSYAAFARKNAALAVLLAYASALEPPVFAAVNAALAWMNAALAYDDEEFATPYAELA